MIVLLSPAKSLTYTEPYPESDIVCPPYFPKETEQIAKVMRKLKVNDLEVLMSISTKLAEENALRFSKFGQKDNLAQPAIFTFSGDVYLGLEAKNIPQKHYSKLQQTLRILSGMYGVLSPFTLLEPYRLEMGTKIAIGNSKNLYEFWKNKNTKLLREQLETHTEKFIVNLASNEYAQSVDFKKILFPTIKCDFYEIKQGQYKQVSFFAKKARGRMARFLIENDIKSVKDIVQFNEDGYSFEPKKSSEKHLVFSREQQ